MNYCHRPRRTLFEILQDFQPLRLPPAYLFDFFPIMRPREFSISSGPTFSKRLSITYAVITYRTSLKTERQGVGTHYLASLTPGDSLSVWIKQGTMRLPADPLNPIILICPGLGIAPMRSFLQHRMKLSETGGEMMFYGCRFLDKDFLFRSELEAWQRSGRLTLFVAQSRFHPERKRYVQHIIGEQSSMVWQWIQRGAYIYVSGLVYCFLHHA